jgi:hypothetical protein
MIDLLNEEAFYANVKYASNETAHLFVIAKISENK